MKSHVRLEAAGRWAASASLVSLRPAARWTTFVQHWRGAASAPPGLQPAVECAAPQQPRLSGKLHRRCEPAASREERGAVWDEPHEPLPTPRPAAHGFHAALPQASKRRLAQLLVRLLQHLSGGAPAAQSRLQTGATQADGLRTLPPAKPKAEGRPGAAELLRVAMQPTVQPPAASRPRRRTQGSELVA